MYAKTDAAFELIEKLGVKYFCFHDIDIAFEEKTLEETLGLVKKSAEYIQKKMEKTTLLEGKIMYFGVDVKDMKRFYIPTPVKNKSRWQDFYIWSLNTKSRLDLKESY